MDVGHCWASGISATSSSEMTSQILIFELITYIQLQIVLVQ